MKKILGVSLVALMAVSTARADIVSKAYVDVDQTKTYNVITRTAKTGVQIEELDTKFGAIPSNKTVAEYIADSVGGVGSTTLTGYSKGSSADPVAATDTINSAVSKLENQIDTKITANAAITGATKTKITYDANGLVTAGADLVASDIPDISGTYATVANVGTVTTQNMGATSATTVVGAISELNTALAGKADSSALGTAAYEAATAFDAAGTAAGLIEDLDASEVTGVIKAISQADGVISATAGTIADSDVASNAAIDLSKIAMPSLSDLSTTGTVVLTAKAGTGEQAGQVIYAWETIQR